MRDVVGAVRGVESLLECWCVRAAVGHCVVTQGRLGSLSCAPALCSSPTWRRGREEWVHHPVGQDNTQDTSGSAEEQGNCCWKPSRKPCFSFSYHF